MTIENIRNEVKNLFPNFENFRDVSYIPNKLSNKIEIREKLIFRSSSLAKYDLINVEKMLKSQDIKFIIDTRDKNELKTYDLNEVLYYSEEFSELYVKNIPLNPFVKKYLENESMKNLYYAIIKDYPKQIGLIFRLISDVLKNRLVIHCQAGVDRTGIIIALLYDLLGIDRHIILIDYLVSREHDIQKDNIIYILNAIDEEFGGIVNYLIKYCNLNQNIVFKIRGQLLK